MPRKRKSPLDKVEIAGNCILVNKALQEKLSDLPPAIYGLSAKTPDQIREWNQVKNFYRMVGAVVDAHSNGEAPPDFSTMGRDQRDAIMNEAWLYISFYNMVFFNWPSIRRKLKKLGKPGHMPPAQSLTLAVDGSKIYNSPHVANFKDLLTPLEVALEVMRYRAIGRMAGPFSETLWTVTPYQQRKAVELDKKVQKNDCRKGLKVQYQEAVAQHMQENPWDLLEGICFSTVKESKPKGAAQRAEKGYREAITADRDLIGRVCHKQRRPKRETWEGGIRIS